jgi:hypothetical protein
MRGVSPLLIAGLIASSFLVGCEAMLSKQLLIRDELNNGIPRQQRVEALFDAFAATEGFSCANGTGLPVVRSCRAFGPRFLELHRSRPAFTIFLDQPYPGGLMSKVPKAYAVASEELENVFRQEFGAAVVVVSK